MSRRSHRAGFTLIELMIVVAIIGILAAVSIPAFMGYTMRARTTEAYTMLADIRARQESYRNEYGRYCGDASATVLSWNPAALAAPGTLRTFNTGSQPWAQLGARPDGPTRFQYRVFAGNPTEPSGIPGLAGDFWYYAQAQADLDGDGTTMVIEAYSMQRQVYVSQGVAGPPLAAGYE